MTKDSVIKQLLTTLILAFSLSLSNYVIACGLLPGYKLSKGVSWGELCDFNEGLASAQKDGKYGFIDKQANIIVPFSYNFTAEFSEGLAIVKKNEHHGYINKKNQVIIPIIYDDVRPFLKVRRLLSTRVNGVLLMILANLLFHISLTKSGISQKD